MNMYQINKGTEVLTGALTYNEGMRKLNEFKRADLDNAAAYTMDCFMPVKRETAKPAPGKGELPTADNAATFRLFVVMYAPTGDVSCETGVIENAIEFFNAANEEEIAAGREPAYILTVRLVKVQL